MPRSDDIYTRTMQSYKESIDGENEQEKKMRLEVQETQYMATNQQLTMVDGKFDDKSQEYIAFKR